MRTTLTTIEASTLLGVDPRSFARWARQHSITPMHSVRVGRSTVTAWAMADLARVTGP